MRTESLWSKKLAALWFRSCLDYSEGDIIGDAGAMLIGEECMSEFASFMRSESFGSWCYMLYDSDPVWTAMKVIHVYRGGVCSSNYIIESGSCCWLLAEELILMEDTCSLTGSCLWCWIRWDLQPGLSYGGVVVDTCRSTVYNESVSPGILVGYGSQKPSDETFGEVETTRLY